MVFTFAINKIRLAFKRLEPAPERSGAATDFSETAACLDQPMGEVMRRARNLAG